ncbi:fimbrial protein [Herbaspirillum sp. meg3]|uniref:fimbrial protein n=1 Tax=Herbaspirillum sp. meg3 TaxID=2025949 RepID=UPI000B988AB1|nr:fimbrial protein [Herbaspirillum sp. meg3]ASU39404.1 fimbrial protein [Herbaspirillum sp. meg3]ASU39578.1 fimbrial protein [Herbaspirillum sp. meg3]
MQKSIIASFLAIAALAPAAAFASDGTITINGTVTAQTCTINGGSPNLAVTLPTVSTSALASAGQTATPTPFTIALTACNPNSGNVRAFFETGSNVLATRRLKNNGTATNLEIGLLNTDNTPISIGAASGAQGAASVAISSGNANLTYMAQYVATGTVGAGTVTTSVTYSIEFP